MKIIFLLHLLFILGYFNLNLKISKSNEPLLIQPSSNAKVLDIKPLKNYKFTEVDDEGNKIENPI